MRAVVIILNSIAIITICVLLILSTSRVNNKIENLRTRTEILEQRVGELCIEKSTGFDKAMIGKEKK